MTHCIYGLINPINNKIFYVGKTTDKRLKTRLRYHTNRFDKNDNKNLVIENILLLGFAPQIKVLEWVFNEEKINKIEKNWIIKYRKLNKNLTNKTNGGNGGSKSLGNGLFGENVHFSKLKEKDIFEIIDLYKNTNMTCEEISIEYGVVKQTIIGIVSGKTWKHLTNGKINSFYKKRTKCIGSKNKSAKLNEGDIPNIRNDLNMGIDCGNIALKYNVDKSTIQAIKHKRSWKHVK